ncbi:hypothetical protein DL96DRAFT_488592 [Flagelloscypha sp. PMI_526]|nr:hypothetical protein DL96DRAFT_488592 [Flagelloscypha sp. PMI_526]
MVLAYSSYGHYLYSRFRATAFVMFERILPAQSPEQKNLAGKTAIVTGSNVGIGLEVARGLASRGATVVLVCRNIAKAEAAKKDIVGQSKGLIRDEQIEVMVIDLSDLNSVRSFVEEWGTRPLDILVNNAGMMTGTFTRSPQGYEYTYTANILAHYLLTLLLLPHIRQNGRIINTTSGLHYNSTNFEISDLDWSKHLTASGLMEGRPIKPASLSIDIYDRTKCLQVIFTRELQLRLEQSEIYKKKGITVHTYHPGVVRSAIWYRDDLISLSKFSKNAMVFMAQVFGVSTTEGAATAIHLAISDSAAKTPGLYWYHMRVASPHRLVENSQIRKAIFDQMAVEAELKESSKL